MNVRSHKLIIFIFLILAIGISQPLFSKQIQFSLVPDRNDIIQYELELWKTENLEQEIPFRVLSNPGPINLYIPDGYEYFRIRAVAKRKVRGYWTELYAVDTFGKKPKPKETAIAKVPVKTDVLVPIQTKDGTSELFLTSKQITIVPVTITKHFKVRYRVNGSNWQTTHSPQLDFPKDGNYRLEYKVTNELGVSDGMQIWEFQVDQTPPESKLFFQSPPFTTQKASFISPKNRLIIQSKDLGSGIGSIRFRYRCDGGSLSEYLIWNEEIYQDIDSICPGDFQLQVSAIDRLGNEEIPKTIDFKRKSKGP
ncbi:hypothetical protein LEP1GSC202_3132 [Leptospira yanagawae serovar Saopaulo str. Sao Paulo = ATCC 700523]|uniref:Ig-like domain-containing protein n=1 Tax=Leptospira yanagawae serovar Saopaulo str. Sao Paulo = ATCC 700523 TaxID=1249483 RepID=A0A5E8HB08_9LEPT|nr:hypothetical protein [Leptospira yanagawae]EOQ88399.1 hypothetical protein LEP1GSC202_3132 [Leptospira yanagawae serovar Saopaulo str. Sao Paulo = ATCC 700523]